MIVEAIRVYEPSDKPLKFVGSVGELWQKNEASELSHIVEIFGTAGDIQIYAQNRKISP